MNDDSDNPYLKRLAKRAGTAHGALSEARVAKSLAARLKPASGAMEGAKGDFGMTKRGRKFLAEAKSTTATSLSLDLGWLSKIALEALDTGAIPVLTVSFVKPDGKPRSVRNAEWVMMPLVFFRELTENDDS